MTRIICTTDASRILITFDTNKRNIFGISAGDASIEATMIFSEVDYFEEAVHDIKRFLNDRTKPDLLQPYDNYYRTAEIKQYGDFGIEFNEKYIIFIDIDYGAETTIKITNKEDFFAKLDAGIEYLKTGKIDIAKLKDVPFVPEEHCCTSCSECNKPC